MLQTTRQLIVAVSAWGYHRLNLGQQDQLEQRPKLCKYVLVVWLTFPDGQRYVTVPPQIDQTDSNSVVQ